MKKIFSILALALAAMTASAVDAPSFSLTKADGAEAHGQISFIVGENQNATTAKEGETVTVVLTPDRGWDLGTASGRWYAAMAMAPRRAGDIDLLDNLTLTPGNKNTWTFTMQRANAEVNFTYKKLMDNEDITVTIGDATYTGQPLTPTVTVKDGNTVLTEGTVYTLSYSNNTDAGLSTAGDKAPSVTITAKSSDGQYAGSVTKTFTIQKAAATISYETTAVNKTFGDADFSNELSMSGDGIVTYSSDNEKVATVDAETGLVHIVAAGSANIIATVADGKNFTYAVKTAQYAVTVSKAAATISYETASISKTYGDEDFTNPLTIRGDGSVTYASDNESVATVNSESGLVHIVGSGNANITATVADGKNFTYAVKTAQYAIGVNTAAMTVSANGYTGTYDGQSHTITVTVTEPEGTTVKYGTKAGEYTMAEAPAYTDTGEYTVFYQVTKENYTTVEGSATVSIAKAAATISYETASISKTYEDEDFTNPLTIRGDGSVTYASDNESVATVNSESGLVHIVGSGNANITATVADGKNFTYAVKTAQYAIGVNTAAMTVSANGYTGTYDGQSHTITVTVTEPEGTTVKYGTKAGEYTMAEAPAYTDAGEYTVFYQVTKENYTTVVASAIVTIQKAPATINYETGSVIKNFGDADFINALTVTGDGSVTYASDNENVATVDSETGEVTIKKLGNANIIATVVDGKNYTYAVKTAQYALTVEGYAVIVPAGEYVTYFDSESALKLATEGAELYTITAVENGEAVLSNPSDVMPKNTPFLMKNNTNEEKTFVLVTCNDPDLAITVADEFIGTLTAKEFTEDDMTAAEFYVCNGLEFIKVRGAGRLAPKKAYLKVNGNNAPLSIPFRRSIGGEGEGTTSIDNLNVNDNDNEATWYDLNGRRLQGKPSQKGIYIKNGKKIVVK